MEIDPSQREILGKLGNLTITVNPYRETDIEITDGADSYEILCASP